MFPDNVWALQLQLFLGSSMGLVSLGYSGPSNRIRELSTLSTAQFCIVRLMLAFLCVCILQVRAWGSRQSLTARECVSCLVDRSCLSQWRSIFIEHHGVTHCGQEFVALTKSSQCQKCFPHNKMNRNSILVDMVLAPANQQACTFCYNSCRDVIVIPACKRKLCAPPPSFFPPNKHGLKTFPCSYFLVCLLSLDFSVHVMMEVPAFLGD